MKGLRLTLPVAMALAAAGVARGDEDDVEKLAREVLDAFNNRDAARIAALAGAHGSLVRVKTHPDSSWIVGLVVAGTADTLMLKVGRSRAALPLAAVRALEVSGGPVLSRDGIKVGAVGGGILAFLAAYSMTEPGGLDVSRQAILPYPLAGAAIGGAAGGLVGAPWSLSKGARLGAISGSVFFGGSAYYFFSADHISPAEYAIVGVSALGGGAVGGLTGHVVESGGTSGLGGFCIGAASGFAIGVATLRATATDVPLAWHLATGAVAGGVGGLVGSVLGAALAERWEEVPVESLRVGISPHGRPQVAVSFRLGG